MLFRGFVKSTMYALQSFAISQKEEAIMTFCWLSRIPVKAFKRKKALPREHSIDKGSKARGSKGGYHI